MRRASSRRLSSERDRPRAESPAASSTWMRCQPRIPRAAFRAADSAASSRQRGDQAHAGLPGSPCGRARSPVCHEHRIREAGARNSRSRAPSSDAHRKLVPRCRCLPPSRCASRQPAPHDAATRAECLGMFERLDAVTRTASPGLRSSSRLPAHGAQRAPVTRRGHEATQQRRATDPARRAPGRWWRSIARMPGSPGSKLERALAGLHARDRARGRWHSPGR